VPNTIEPDPFVFLLFFSFYALYYPSIIRAEPFPAFCGENLWLGISFVAVENDRFPVNLTPFCFSAISRKSNLVTFNLVLSNRGIMASLPKKLPV